MSSARVWSAFVYAIGLLIAPSAQARAESARFNIAAQSLPTALQAFAAQADIQLLYEHTAVAGAMSHAISGELDKRVALEQLLRSNGFEIIYCSDNAAAIRLVRTNPEKRVADDRKKQSAEQNIGPTQYDPSSNTKN